VNSASRSSGALKRDLLVAVRTPSNRLRRGEGRTPVDLIRGLQTGPSNMSHAGLPPPEWIRSGLQPPTEALHGWAFPERLIALDERVDHGATRPKLGGRGRLPAMRWKTPPPPSATESATEILHQLGRAVSEAGRALERLADAVPSFVPPPQPLAPRAPSRTASKAKAKGRVRQHERCRRLHGLQVEHAAGLARKTGAELGLFYPRPARLDRQGGRKFSSETTDSGGYVVASREPRWVRSPSPAPSSPKA
jgi:hypothetical protein